MQRFITTTFATASLAVLSYTAFAQQPLQLKQSQDNSPATLLTAGEVAALGDPFFEIVLRDHADITSLRAIEQLLQPRADQRLLFVVDENIANPSLGQGRRAVIAFKGTHAGTGIILNPNVMLSVFFSSDNFSDTPDAIEAWGWDNHRGRYNYYRMDDSGTPSLQQTWKFRGSSVSADLLGPLERRGTCMQCHVNGAPIMKELALPWNNWHSSKFLASYLRDDWPVGTTERLQGLKEAEDLETQFIIPAVEQFNTRRINAALRRRDDTGDIQLDNNGDSTILEGRRLLRHLFTTTEVNLISAEQLSGMHPLGPGQPGRPSSAVAIPHTFFLNANLLADALEIREARTFQAMSRVESREYRRLVSESGVRIDGRPGDANFAWFVPEPGNIDNSMVVKLLERKIVSPAFVASVLAIDLENPVFSQRRASLLRFVPNSFDFDPTPPPGAAPHPDRLTTMVIEQLRAANPSPGSAEAEFLAFLQDPDPVARLQERVQQYRERVKLRLENQATRQDELRRLYGQAIATRQLMKRDRVLGALDETGNRLFPLP